MRRVNPNPQDVAAVIWKLAEARDQALWKVLYFRCQRCGQIKPIEEAVGVEFPPDDGSPRPEIWCKSCLEEVIAQDM